MAVNTRTPRALPDEGLLTLEAPDRYEIVKGKIVPMAPTGYTHGEIESNFTVVLKGFVRQHHLGKVMGGEVGIYTQRGPDTVRGADVLFISNERYAMVQATAFLDVAPDLIVEVMSPDDRWNRVMEKLTEYFEIGVKLVWIADPETQTVYAYRSLTDVQRFSKGQQLSGGDVLPGFSVSVAELFTD